MTAALYLPWVRRGLATAAGGRDPADGGPLPLRGTLTATVSLADSRGTRAEAAAGLDLLGPGDVVGLDPAQVVRVCPPDGATGVESGYFPCAELAAADLPWLFTPAVAGGRSRLRPWLVLVCVEVRDGVTYDAGGSPLPVLRMSGDDAARELPDLAESWAWAHVHSVVGAPDVAAAVERGDGSVLARFLAPRRLEDDRTYRAALVPAFDVGVLAGLGQDVAAATQAGPAWRLDALPAVVELPVHLSWTFTTAAEASTFEELARRLEPDDGPARFGVRPATLDGGGVLAPFAGPARFGYEGALRDVGSEGDPLGARAATWFEDGMEPVLERGARRPEVPRRAPDGYVPETDDPVLGPPLHGSFAADRYTVPRRGWLRDANLDPRRRSAAGLGATVVRAGQDAFVAAAWDGTGQLRELQEELNRTRLAAEAGRAQTRRLTALDDAALVQATARLHAFLPLGASTVGARVAGSAVVPAGATSATFTRLGRRGGLLARRSAPVSGSPPRVGVAGLDRFVAASTAARAPESAPLSRFGATFVGAGTVTRTTTFRLVEAGTTTDVVAVQPAPAIVTTASDDLTGAAAAVRGALDPMPAAAATLAARVSGIAIDVAADVPTRMPVAPRFAEPLLTRLLDLPGGGELLLPGVRDVAPNSVRLLEVNEAWVAAFLVGANHAWVRAALWNEFPLDVRATAFATFWPHPDGSEDLGEDLAGWLLDDALDAHVGSAGTTTVLLVRGDVVRLHPETEFFLLEPDARGRLLDSTGALPAARTTWPEVRLRLDDETLFVMFDADPATARDEGWFVGVQEPPTGPRFGLDALDGTFGGRPATSWAELTWGDLVSSAAELAALSYVRIADAGHLDGLSFGGATWARNAAHLAAITEQQPFRLLVPAAHLLPPGVS